MAGYETHRCALVRASGRARSPWWRRIARHRAFIDSTVFGADLDVVNLPRRAEAWPGERR